MSASYTPGDYIKHPEPAGMTTCCEDNGGSSDTSAGNLTGTGSPVGAVTPTAVGQLYTDQNAPHSLWQSTGLTNASWDQLIGP